MKAEIEQLRAQGLSDGEIAGVVGVDERVVAAYGRKDVTAVNSSPPGPGQTKLVLVTEDEAAEFADIMKGLARHSDLDTVRASCARWLVNEHFGRNDVKAGLTVTNNNVTLVAAAIQAANAKQMAKLGLTPPARVTDTDDFNLLPAPPAP